MDYTPPSKVTKYSESRIRGIKRKLFDTEPENMPAAKKTKYSRSFGKKRTYYKKPYGRKTKSKLAPLLGSTIRSIHSYTLSFNNSGSSSSEISKSWTFNVGSFPGTDALLKIYDAYRIRMIEVKLDLVTNPNSTVSQTNMLYYPTAYLVADKTDDDVKNLNWMSSHPRMKQKTMKPGDTMYYKFYPTVSMRTGISNSWGIARNMWIEAKSTSEAYYGLKFITVDDTPAALCAWKMTIKAHIEYKGVGYN